MTETPTALPMPAIARWQPLRSGLVNLFLYDNEEFRFVKGRLLLRGNNGTGKSRVLALQLPFLLDGEIVSSRVEPDGDPARRMEWHLLMDRYPHRMGYTWVEFGRRREDGTAEFCTLGCGMEATKGGKLHRWYFITPQRVGCIGRAESLALVRENGSPVPKDALQQALAGGGTLYTTVRDYRRAVDDRLFHLGEERYLALINLLIQLRKPQLSRELDERKLSKALSDSLPPLDPATISDVAEAFRDLERDREELERYRRSVEAVKRFDRNYREYAKIAVGRNTDQLRAAHNAYEGAQRAVRKSEGDLASAERAHADAQNAVAEVRLAQEAATGEEQALLDSPAMQAAHELHRRKSEAEAAAQRAEQATEDLAGAEADRQRRDAAREDCGRQALAERRRAEAAGSEAETRAAAIGLTLSVADALADPPRAEAVRETCQTDLQRCREGYHHLSGLRDKLTAIEAELRLAEQRRSDAETHLSVAQDDQVERRNAHKQASGRLVEAAGEWVRAARVLVLADGVEILDTLRQWCETLSSESPLRLAADRERNAALTSIAREESEIGARDADLHAREEALLSEKAQLEAGRELGPPAPPTRDPSVRADRPGVPLWAACEFRDGVGSAERAGYEAALEAAGILDAWISPDGTVVDASGDTLVELTDGSPAPGRTLAEVLAAAVNPGHPQHSAVSAETITRVLGHIAVEPAACRAFACADGAWRNGVLRGRWHKEQAEFIGAGAREAARRRRLARIAEELAALARERETLRARTAGLHERRAVLADEWERLPGEAEVARAMAAWNAASAQVARATEALARACAQVQALRERHREAREAYVQTAVDLGLERWADRLREYRDGLESCVQSLSALWPTLAVLAKALENVERARAEMQRAETQCEEAGRRRAAAAAEAARKAKEYETLQAQAGRTVREAEVQLDEVRRRIQGLKTEAEERHGTLARAAEKRGADRQSLENARAEFARADGERTRHIEAFRDFASTGMLEELGEMPEGLAEWSPTRLVDYVREVHARLGAERLSDEAWDRMCDNLHSEFQRVQSELSAQNLRPETEKRHGIDVVSVEYDGKLRRIPDLLGRLEAQVMDRQRLLSAAERTFIENHLIGEVAEHLHTLICEAADLVRNMNVELSSRPTSTGMRLRFQWQPVSDGPPGTDAACALLRRTTATWSEREREALAAFLHDRIVEVRETSEGGTWRENLEVAVDYRSWHAFAVERMQNGVWRKLTKRTHGTGSGGEKALALTIPQFAAAAAHYHTVPHAPRLIMLDEVFAGIDRDMRDKCMGLLETFDLDFVMTSESEWGCYPSISGLAISHLTTHADCDAVAVTPWVWNGKERIPAGSLFDEVDQAR